MLPSRRSNAQKDNAVFAVSTSLLVIRYSKRSWHVPKASTVTYMSISACCGGTIILPVGIALHVVQRSGTAHLEG